MIGVPLGATLTYNDNDEITCVVTNLSPPEVVATGNIYSLYELTCTLVGDSFCNGSSYYWKYKGETLYDRTRRFEAYHRSD